MKRIISLFLIFCLCAALVACGQTQPNAPAAQLDMPQVYAKLQQAAQLPEMIEMDELLMLDYCGIKAEDVSQAVVLVCADSLKTDEIWLLEAVDAKAAGRLVELAEKRLAKKGEESITYSPEQYQVVQKAQLIQVGNYVALLVSPDAEAMAQVFNQAAGK